MLNPIVENDMPLTAQVVEQILKYIMGQNLTEGDKLPNEFELAQSLGVGRGTIREAIKLLVSRNVLVIQRGKGTFVAQNPGLVSDPLGFAFVKDKHRLASDLLEIRMILEPQAAALAAQKATDEDIEEMKGLCIEIEQSLKGRNREQYLALNRHLHACIAKSTHNSVIPKLVSVVQEDLVISLSEDSDVPWEQFAKSHFNIVKAIVERNALAASMSMTAHLQYNKTTLDNLNLAEK